MPAWQYAPVVHSPVQLLEDNPMLLPKVPAGQRVGTADPGGQYDPAGQSVVHTVRRAKSSAYFPGSHWLQTATPPRLYVPAAHAATVSVTLPAGHVYPALQVPEQGDEFRPCIAP